jgi:uncharacterized protein
MKEKLHCQFWIKASPRSHETKCLGWEENFLKIKIKALPSKGSANEELITYLSILLKIPKSRIFLNKGLTSKLKQVQIEGLSLDEVKEKIQNFLL